MHPQQKLILFRSSKPRSSLASWVFAFLLAFVFTFLVNVTDKLSYFTIYQNMVRIGRVTSLSDLVRVELIVAGRQGAYDTGFLLVSSLAKQFVSFNTFYFLVLLFVFKLFVANAKLAGAGILFPMLFYTVQQSFIDANVLRQSMATALFVRLLLTNKKVFYLLSVSFHKFFSALYSVPL